MVKNANGGNKSKRGARKHAAPPPRRNLRMIQDGAEQYAVVTKIYGGPNCEVMCMDGKLRMCIIRNKFRGRHKRDNHIATNTWVLVGLRDWEARAVNKAPRCDMLEVYNSIEKEKLQTTVKDDLTALISRDEKETGNRANDGVVFIDDDEEMENDELCPCPHSTVQDQTTAQVVSDDDEIDVDEI